ncbi:unnamed protein product [Amoebophrya sp. A25]|nr:unnamed protein product [Amoebophrya sp. A25]|eukprot:GSA25T00006996001.1
MWARSQRTGDEKEGEGRKKIVLLSPLSGEEVETPFAKPTLALKVGEWLQEHYLPTQFDGDRASRNVKIFIASSADKDDSKTKSNGGKNSASTSNGEDNEDRTPVSGGDIAFESCKEDEGGSNEIEKEEGERQSDSKFASSADDLSQSNGDDVAQHALEEVACYKTTELKPKDELYFFLGSHADRYETMAARTQDQYFQALLVELANGYGWWIEDEDKTSSSNQKEAETWENATRKRLASMGPFRLEWLTPKPEFPFFHQLESAMMDSNNTACARNKAGARPASASTTKSKAPASGGAITSRTRSSAFEEEDATRGAPKRIRIEQHGRGVREIEVRPNHMSPPPAAKPVKADNRVIFCNLLDASKVREPSGFSYVMPTILVENPTEAFPLTEPEWTYCRKMCGFLTKKKQKSCRCMKVKNYRHKAKEMQDAADADDVELWPLLKLFCGAYNEQLQETLLMEYPNGSDRPEFAESLEILHNSLEAECLNPAERIKKAASSQEADGLDCIRIHPKDLPTECVEEAEKHCRQVVVNQAAMWKRRTEQLYGFEADESVGVFGRELSEVVRAAGGRGELRTKAPDQLVRSLNLEIDKMILSGKILATLKEL